MPKHTCSCNEYRQVCCVSMGNLVSMLVSIYICSICTCDGGYVYV